MPDQPRPVWLDGGTIVAINQALIDADQRGVNERALTWNLGAIVAAWDAAPADPTEAAQLALDPWTNIPEPPATAVLNALGMPDA